MQNSFNLPHNETHSIVNAITKRLGACTIYAFDYYCRNGQEHFFLLVFSPKACSGLEVNIVNAIAEQSGKKLQATILLHKPKDLSSRQPGQQYFFDSVLRHGQRLALDKSNPPYILDNDPKEHFEASQSFWRKCEAVAQFNFYAAANHPHEGVGLCRIALLHVSVQQIALGIIRIFMSYTPNEYSLRFLLELYSHVTAAPFSVFPTDTPEQQRLFKMLCAPTSLLNHRIRLHADEEDFEYLLAACESFLEQSRKIVESRIRELKDQEIK